MIKFSFEGSDERIRRWIATKPPKLIEALRRKMDALHISLQAMIVGEKLSGQVLHHRSGKLIGSIRVILANLTGTQLAGYVEGAGGPAWYGKLHEFGTETAFRIVPVNKKALAFMLDGKQVIVRSVMHPAFQQRSFMRTAQEEYRPTIIRGLQEALDEAIRES